MTAPNTSRKRSPTRAEVVLYALVGTIAIASVAAACAGSSTSGEPVRSVAAPGLIPVEPDAGSSGSPDGDSTNVVGAAAARGLSRGTGTPEDRALAEGDDAYDNHRWEEAAHAYRRAAGLAPGDPAPIVGLVRVTLAREQVPTGHAAAPGNPVLVRAVDDLKRALTLDSEYGPAHLELGRAWLVLDRASDAIASLRRAVRARPNSPDAHSSLGVALLATGQGSEAVDALRKAADLAPDDVAHLTNLGTALLLRGHAHEAIRVFERAVVLAPDDGKLRTDLGTGYLAVQDLRRALPHLRKAVELEPDRATFHSNLGYALQMSKDHAAAIAAYRKAIQLDPKLGSAWINLGTALAQIGKHAEARKAFQQAIELDPTDPRPRSNLQELDEVQHDGGG